VIRGTIFRETKLTSSAGIGPNKLIAKIASEMNKPNGQFEVKPEEVPVSCKICRFARSGESARRPSENWKNSGKNMRRVTALLASGANQSFPANSVWDLYDLCRGNRRPAGRTGSPRKSLSTEETFASRSDDAPSNVKKKLEELFQDLMADLAQKGINSRDHKNIREIENSNDFTRTTVRARRPCAYVTRLPRFFSMKRWSYRKPVRLIGAGGPLRRNDT
jgi:DNA polymerase-4